MGRAFAVSRCCATATFPLFFVLTVAGAGPGCIVGAGDDTTIANVPGDAGEGGPADASLGDASKAAQEAGSGPSDAASDMTVQDAPAPSDGGQAAAAIATTPINFGAVTCGSASVTQTLTVGNTGLAPLALSAVTTGAGFSVMPTQLAVPSGGSGTLTVAVNVQSSATAGAVLTGSLSIFTNDPNKGSLTIGLSATPTGATVTLGAGTPSNINFPTSPVGGTPPTQSLSITNSGNAPATVTLSAPTPAVGFGFLSGGLPASSPVTIAPSQTLTEVVAYSPTTGSGGQAMTATSTLTTAGAALCGTSVASISFSGTAVLGNITGWPSVMDFGNVDCGGTAPAPQTFTLVNTGTVDEQITGCRVGAPDGSFTVCTSGSGPSDASSTSGFDAILPAETIPANGGSLTVTVGAPAVPATSSEQPIEGVLTILVDPPTSTPFQPITLREEPTGAVLSFDPPTFGSFGSPIVLLGPQATQTFNVVNTGNWPPSGGANVTLSVVSGSGAEAGVAEGGGAMPQAFTVLTPALTVPAGGQGAERNDTLQFSPIAAGVNSATLTMTAAAGTPLCGPLPAMTLIGTGIGGGASVVPASLSFFAPCSGAAPAAQVFTVTNNGTRDLNWAMGPVTGPGASRYTVGANPAPGLLHPGLSSTVVVTAQPFLALPQGSAPLSPAPAGLAAQLTITTDVPFDNGHVVSLSEIPVGDQFSLSTQSLQYGQFPVQFPTPQTTVPQGFTVANGANVGSPDGHFSLVIQGTGSAAYTLTPQASGTDIGAGAVSVTENVTFTPTSAIPYPASIAITTTDTGLCTPLPASIQLIGTGSAGHVSVSPGTLTFGDGASGFVNCGATAPPQTIVVANNVAGAGGNQAFNVTAITLGKQGANAPFTYSTSAATPPPFGLSVGGSFTIGVTPNPIPAAADPNDATIFHDILTITTDAAGDLPHVIPLTMQARGAVIANTPLTTTWNFGTINAGSIGTLTNTFQNTGNSPVSVALVGLADPAVFGLQQSAPAASGFSSIIGQFTPPALDGSWSAQGTLVMTATQAFCAPPPPAWQSTTPTTWQGPAIALSGSSNSNPPITISATAVSFPTTDCGNGPPAAQSLTLTNNTNQTQNYTAQIRASAHPGTYTIGSSLVSGDGGTASGTIPAMGVASVLVLPNAVTPGPGVVAGSYGASLEIDVATNPVTTYSIPISWTLNGAVLSLTPGGTPFTDGTGTPFYVADSTSGHLLPMSNTGTAAVTIEFVVQPPGAFTFLPALPISLLPGIGGSPQLEDLSPTPTCPPSPSAAGAATFVYASGPVCQPFVLPGAGGTVTPLPAVSVHYCSGTF